MWNQLIQQSIIDLGGDWNVPESRIYRSGILNQYTNHWLCNTYSFIVIHCFVFLAAIVGRSRK
ncbi:hypothetical protein ACQKMD_10580 [Viridibacillus sp. NPDC096237]|uniref:hypothetical protein n=1 Tax=Viridibacillus sp. NPDC096237 TaxID=3390721 RepID=UPI003CFE694F